MVGSCPRNAWSKNRKNGFKGEGWVGVGRGKERCFGCGEKGHYVGQCLKASPRKCFPAGKWDIYHYSVEEVPCVSFAESWVTRQYHVQN